MNDITTTFAENVFNESAMREHLPKEIYKALKATMRQGMPLDPKIADIVANAMKNWAVSKGATHYTHWFQPMTGDTAEKHDSFLTLDSENRAVLAFSGKNLVKGESDASSFPSGGLRATFEARGYTVWDTTSYAFVKDGSLYIPTAFCSYCGEALDMKTPLLRSMDALNKQALRILALFGNGGNGDNPDNMQIRRVTPQVGAEQEYFLIDKQLYLRRPDLMYTGRALFGNVPPKCHDLGGHYFGRLKPRVSAFMKEVDRELWQLGVCAATRHNENAPSQHELAVAYTTANIATDHNQIVMETMRTVAARHGLVCLFHEKPFPGISGSGKHNNWSLSTDTGVNLLNPGKTPHENTLFLLFLSAVIKGADEYSDLLLASAVSAGNAMRFGGHEAPPEVMSVYLGDELTAILDSIEKGEDYCSQGKVPMYSGVATLPQFNRDTSDRNRTSPFAFTGNKFEFRMPGASASVAEPNIVINTAVAEALRQFADALETSENDDCILELIKSTYTKHKKIIFNGDNYAHNDTDCEHDPIPKTLKTAVAQKNVELYERHGVFTESELVSRHEVRIDKYCKAIYTEAVTMLDMAKTQIIPACIKYQNDLVGLILQVEKLGCNNAVESVILGEVSAECAALYEEVQQLESMLSYGNCTLTVDKCSKVIEVVGNIQIHADILETHIPKEYWKLPTYSEMLFWE